MQTQHPFLGLLKNVYLKCQLQLTGKFCSAEGAEACPGSGGEYGD